MKLQFLKVYIWQLRCMDQHGHSMSIHDKEAIKNLFLGRTYYWEGNRSSVMYVASRSLQTISPMQPCAFVPCHSNDLAFPPLVHETVHTCRLQYRQENWLLVPVLSSSSSIALPSIFWVHTQRDALIHQPLPWTCPCENEFQESGAIFQNKAACNWDRNIDCRCIGRSCLWIHGIQNSQVHQLLSFTRTSLTSLYSWTWKQVFE